MVEKQVPAKKVHHIAIKDSHVYRLITTGNRILNAVEAIDKDNLTLNLLADNRRYDTYFLDRAPQYRSRLLVKPGRNPQLRDLDYAGL